jgi:hypothetical protein
MKKREEEREEKKGGGGGDWENGNKGRVSEWEKGKSAFLCKLGLIWTASRGIIHQPWHRHAAQCNSMLCLVSDTQACCTLHLSALPCNWHTGMLHTTPPCLALYLTHRHAAQNRHAAHYTSLPCIVSDTQACYTKQAWCTLHLPALHCICRTGMLHTVHHCLAKYLTHRHAAHYTSLPCIVSDTQACCTLHLTALHCIWHTGMLHTAPPSLALYLTHRHAVQCTLHLTALHCIWHTGML